MDSILQIHEGAGYADMSLTHLLTHSLTNCKLLNYNECTVRPVLMCKITDIWGEYNNMCAANHTRYSERESWIFIIS